MMSNAKIFHTYTYILGEFQKITNYCTYTLKYDILI